jgi:peptidyl-prolyl cis-trans isomerase C
LLWRRVRTFFVSAFDATIIEVTKIFVLAAFGMVLSAQSAAVKPDEVVLTVGDRTLTAAQYEAIVHTSLPPEQQAAALGPAARQFAQNLIEALTLSSEAKKQGLDKDPQITLMLALQQENILANAAGNKIMKDVPIPDSAIQSYYDAHKNDYEILTAQQILVRVKDAPTPPVPGKPELSDEQALAKAQALRKRILAGEDFAKAAEAESDDLSDLGEVTRGQLPAEVEKVAFALKPGDVSEPVKTSFGYHIIQVRTHTVKSLADVKSEIEAKVRPEIAQKAIEALIAGTTVELNDEFFK